MATGNITASLYNGKHDLTFTAGNHRYRVDGAYKQGVTTILSKVLAKPALMLWPMNMALKYIQTNHAAYAGADGIITAEAIERMCKEAEAAHRKRADAGADTGSRVHELVEQYLLGNVMDVSREPEEVQRAYQGFAGWHASNRPEVVGVEQVVYSEELDYAGTFDSILKLDGKNYLVDLKTTNASQHAPDGVYAEYFIQLGAYYRAYSEQYTYEINNGGSKLVMIDDLMILSCQKNGTVKTKTASELGFSADDCWDLWDSVFSVHRDLTKLQDKLARKARK